VNPPARTAGAPAAVRTAQGRALVRGIAVLGLVGAAVLAPAPALAAPATPAPAATPRALAVVGAALAAHGPAVVASPGSAVPAASRPAAPLLPAAPGSPLPDPDGPHLPRPFPRPLPDPSAIPAAPTRAPTPADAHTPHAALAAGRGTDDPDSPWVVVNKARPLDPVDHVPAALVTVGAVQVRPEVAGPLQALLDAAAVDGLTLPVLSGYRSYADQVRVHGGWVAALGQERADQVSARPGHSEHQTGLAVDLGSGSDPACEFEACYAQTAEGRWLAERAGEFGFVVRYTPEGREETGFDAEGWHLRWVGPEVVEALRASGAVTLEALFGLPGGWRYP
jgi:D-alanyl-D-alanine carboxypeptidase